MVATGLGVTILPEPAALQPSIHSPLLAMRRFSGIKPKRKIALAYRKGFARQQTIDILYNVLQQCLSAKTKPRMRSVDTH